MDNGNIRINKSIQDSREVEMVQTETKIRCGRERRLIFDT